MTGQPQGSAGRDTFPKLLLANAAERGGLPASREKEYGIWQSWTWSCPKVSGAGAVRGLRGLRGWWWMCRE